MIIHKRYPGDHVVELWDDEEDRLIARLTGYDPNDAVRLYLYPDDAEEIEVAISADCIDVSTIERSDALDFERTKKLMSKLVGLLNQDLGVQAEHAIGEGSSDWLRVNIEEELEDGRVARAYFHFELKNCGVDYLRKQDAS